MNTPDFNKMTVFSYIFSYLLLTVHSHSWVECTDYRGGLNYYEPSKCFGLPRPLSDGRNVGATFGLDIGMDFRPKADGTGARCQGNIGRGLNDNYPTGLVSYEAGNTYTLAWPPKNHVAADCSSSNQYIPDSGLTLHLSRFDDISDPSQSDFDNNQLPASFTSIPHTPDTIDFKGFQKCPKFCEDPDKSLCTGEFSLPLGLAPGIYTFQWKWAFNSETDLYATCWEAEITGGSSTGSPIASTPQPPVETTSTVSPGNWQNVKLTHFWDCNGMGCDASTLQPWDESKYVASPGYQPQDPANHGGSVYGEQMWLVGAASDDLATLMGEDAACCGSDTNSGGCGKCALIRVPSAVNPGWTALVMKKNRCPPWSNGCQEGNVHFDMAVPGYDNLAYSTANVCGQRQGTGFSSPEDSDALGSWYTQYDNTAQAAVLCTDLPSEFQQSCELFSSWGWTRGDPDAEIQIVDCPTKFQEYISEQFDASGVVDDEGSTDAPQPEPTSVESTQNPTAPPQPTTPGDDDNATCYLNECGCPPYINGAQWCSDLNSVIAGEWCLASESNCAACNGVWCGNQSPGEGPVTPTPEPQSDCAAGNIIAPGTNLLITYSALDYEDTAVLNCPDGYEGSFTILCTETSATVRTVDGYCNVYCLSSAQMEIVAHTEARMLMVTSSTESPLDASEKPATIYFGTFSLRELGLLGGLIMVTVILFTYVCITQKWCCVKKDSTKITSLPPLPKRPVNYNGALYQPRCP